MSSTHLVWNFKWYSLAWINATHHFLVVLLLNFNHFCPICSGNFWCYISLLSWQTWIFFSEKFSWTGFQYGVIARLIDGVWNVVAPSRVNLTSIMALKSVGCFKIQNLISFRNDHSYRHHYTKQFPNSKQQKEVKEKISWSQCKIFELFFQM